MPGHKGRIHLGPEAYDITEIEGADVLYSAKGIILESERNAEVLFGTARTVYSAEGSSLSIRAMLYLCSLYAAKNGRKCKIAAGRNAHRVFLSACALLDIDIDWLYPEDSRDIVACSISPAMLENYLSGCAEPPAAVYITSPDYLGNIADIAALSGVCRRFGCLLIVDNAHGAYLKYLPEDRHPITLGADMCCDSAHKTLPVLTGGGYLQISKNAPAMLSQYAETAMALFASTSPSYLILQSLDLCNSYLEKLPGILKSVIPVWERLKKTLTAGGWTLSGDEPIKLTVLPKSYGYTGTELAALLEKSGFVCEFADSDHMVYMLPLEFDPALPERLLMAFGDIPRREEILSCPPPLSRAKTAYSPHEVLFMPSREIAANDSLGCVMHAPTVSCPPAIPIVVSGEVINETAIAAMEYYGIDKITVADI